MYNVGYDLYSETTCVASFGEVKKAKLVPPEIENLECYWTSFMLFHRSRCLCFAINVVRINIGRKQSLPSATEYPLTNGTAILWPISEIRWSYGLL